MSAIFTALLESLASACEALVPTLLHPLGPEEKVAKKQPQRGLRAVRVSGLALPAQRATVRHFYLRGFGLTRYTADAFQETVMLFCCHLALAIGYAPEA